MLENDPSWEAQLKVAAVPLRCLMVQGRPVHGWAIARKLCPSPPAQDQTTAQVADWLRASQHTPELADWFWAQVPLPAVALPDLVIQAQPAGLVHLTVSDRALWHWLQALLAGTLLRSRRAPVTVDPPWVVPLAYVQARCHTLLQLGQETGHWALPDLAEAAPPWQWVAAVPPFELPERQLLSQLYQALAASWCDSPTRSRLPHAAAILEAFAQFRRQRQLFALPPAMPATELSGATLRATARLIAWWLAPTHGAEPLLRL